MRGSGVDQWEECCGLGAISIEAELPRDAFSEATSMKLAAAKQLTMVKRASVEARSS